MTRRVRGIILQKRDFRENDRLFVIYTDELGKIEAVAKGARKITSKMAGHLDYFSVVDLMIAPGKMYYQIAGVDTARNFTGIKSSFVKVILASYCLEVVDIFTKTDQPDIKIFEMLIKTFSIFDLLSEKGVNQIFFIAKSFVFKFLAVQGFAPELFFCGKCRKKILPGINFFDASLGGLVCRSCGSSGGIPISTSAIKILRFILANSLKKLTRLKVNRTQRQEVFNFIDSFLAMHQDRELKSDIWIKKIAPMG